MTDPRNEFDQRIGFPVPDWHGARRPEPTRIDGHYCRLERLNIDAHADALSHAFCEPPEPKDWTYLPYGPFHDRERFIDWLSAHVASTDPMFFAIVDRSTDRAQGLASLMRIDPANGCIEVGHIHYAPALQRQPAATEAMYLLARYCFETLGYRRYEWKCDALNERSRRAAERLGFRYEGLFRQAVVYKGRNRDTAWYSMLDHEWPERRRAFETWLDPQNFDASGRQRQALSTETPP